MLKLTMITTTALLALLFSVRQATAFTQPQNHFGVTSQKVKSASPQQLFSSFDDDFIQETPEQTKQRIQDLVDENPVLLFMKGSKIFPQCGFSSTAVQILNTFGIEFQSGTNMKFFPSSFVPMSLKYLLTLFFLRP